VQGVVDGIGNGIDDARNGRWGSALLNFGLAGVDIATAGKGSLLKNGVKEGAELALKRGGREVVEAGTQYTRSSLRLGQDMHKAYKADVVDPLNGLFKEYRLPSGRRIDFLDINGGTVFELKPFNPRAMRAGERQLEAYAEELRSIPEFSGRDWTKALEVY
jgi:hypothetical protein